MKSKWLSLIILVGIGVALLMNFNNQDTDDYHASGGQNQTDVVHQNDYDQTEYDHDMTPQYTKAGMPIYKPVSGVNGNLVSVGSDTLANLMTLWSEKFRDFYSSMNMQIQAAGSSTAPPALTESSSHFGPMSRAMKKKEIDSFVKRFGYEPTQIPVALDGLALYVNTANKVRRLTIPEIDAIFSSTLKCGYKSPINNWSDIGTSRSKIQLFGRNSVSGTYGYFKQKALCKGDYRSDVNEQPGSAAVVQAVAVNLNAIGYSGMGYNVSGVKTIEVAKKNSGPYVKPTVENIVSGSYPLSRLLYVYVNKHPEKGLNKRTTEFLKMVLSQQGQNVVKKDGFVPLSANLVKKYRELLN